MNVLLINGSPHKKGCTYTALSEVAGQLEKNGIGSNIVHIGSKPIRGCIACGACRETGLCVFDDDPVNECSGLLKAADGLIVGSPVYYAAPNGALCAFLDRLFYMKSGAYAYKPAAAVVSCRRGGASAAFDRLNKYFTISCMPIVSSQYWNSVHGNTPEEVRTRRVCRSCGPWATTWRGCSSALRPPRGPCPIRCGSRGHPRISSVRLNSKHDDGFAQADLRYGPAFLGVRALPS